MTSRKRLPNRRPREIVAIDIDGHRYNVGVSFKPAGRVREVFVTEQKQGSTMDADHGDADSLMCETLRSIGYGAGVDLYQDLEKWYA